jgi:hypothetical protein
MGEGSPLPWEYGRLKPGDLEPLPRLRLRLLPRPERERDLDLEYDRLRDPDLPLRRRGVRERERDLDLLGLEEYFLRRALRLRLLLRLREARERDLELAGDLDLAGDGERDASLGLAGEPLEWERELEGAGLGLRLPSAVLLVPARFGLLLLEGERLRPDLGCNKSNI